MWSLEILKQLNNSKDILKTWARIQSPEEIKINWVGFINSKGDWIPEHQGFRKVRLYLKMTATDFAAALGITKSRMYLTEMGIYPVSGENMQQIKQLLKK